MLSRTPDAFNPSKPCLASLSSFEFYCDPSFQKIKDRTRWSWWARDQLVACSSKRLSVNIIDINSFWCEANNQLLFKKILHCRSILSNSFCLYFFSPLAFLSSLFLKKQQNGCVCFWCKYKTISNCQLSKSFSVKTEMMIFSGRVLNHGRETKDRIWWARMNHLSMDVAP